MTTYRYEQPVAFGEHRVMFRPRDSYDYDQRLLHASLDIEPAAASLHWTHDVFGNSVPCARFAGRSASLRFESLIELGALADAHARFPDRRGNELSALGDRVH